MLTVALPKGALLKDSIALFQQIGLDFTALLDKANRQLEVWDTTHTARALLVRNSDVPVYVEYGQAQLGVVDSAFPVAYEIHIGLAGRELSSACFGNHVNQPVAL